MEAALTRAESWCVRRASAPGSRVAGYLLEEQDSARGGMAVGVPGARPNVSTGTVALKILGLRRWPRTQNFRQRFMRESRAAAIATRRSGNIIPGLRGPGEASGVLFIAMRFVRGGDVQFPWCPRFGPMHSEPGGPRSFRRSHPRWMPPYARGLVHRDVKAGEYLARRQSWSRPARPRVPSATSG